MRCPASKQMVRYKAPAILVGRQPHLWITPCRHAITGPVPLFEAASVQAAPAKETVALPRGLLPTGMAAALLGSPGGDSVWHWQSGWVAATEHDRSAAAVSALE